jgi:hypothetical protein
MLLWWISVREKTNGPRRNPLWKKDLETVRIAESEDSWKTQSPRLFTAFGWYRKRLSWNARTSAKYELMVEYVYPRFMPVGISLFSNCWICMDSGRFAKTKNPFSLITNEPILGSGCRLMLKRMRERPRKRFVRSLISYRLSIHVFESIVPRFGSMYSSSKYAERTAFSHRIGWGTNLEGTGCPSHDQIRRRRKWNHWRKKGKFSKWVNWTN